MIFASLIPLPYRILAMALFAAAIAAFFYVKGMSHVQDKWDLATMQQQVLVTKIQMQRADVTTEVVTKYVDRVRIVKEKGAEIVKEVPVYVPSDSCSLPGGFRVLHDAAALGVVSDPAGITNAPTVPAQDVAAIVAENYATYHECAEQVIALQQWINLQGEVK